MDKTVMTDSVRGQVVAFARAAVKAEAERRAETEALKRNVFHCRNYAVEEIEVATNWFSTSLKLGQGHAGLVFKATLDHTPVAVRILRPDVGQGLLEFQNEVETLSRVRHPNMVTLLGVNISHKCLVYEFMDNGSLEDHLFRRGNTRTTSTTLPPILPWRTRFKIAAEIATALLFLHRATPGPALHLCLKPSNVLLDRNYATKITDPCRACRVPPTAAHYWYVDPVFFRTGTLQIESDVFSLGTVMLQIITARPPVGLVNLVRRAVHEGGLADVLDPDVLDWPMKETLRFAELALMCVALRREDRPDLGATLLPQLNRLKDHHHQQQQQQQQLNGLLSCKPAENNIHEDMTSDSSSSSSDDDTSTSGASTSSTQSSDADWAIV